MSRPLTPILDEHASQVMLRLWMPVDTICDTPHPQLGVSADGTIIGHNEIVAPESDAERWSAFDGAIARRIEIPEDQLVARVAVSRSGRIVGDPSPEPVPETDAERAWSPGSGVAAPLSVREDWA